MNDIVEQLDKLAELKAQVDVLKFKKQELIDSVLTPEIKQQVKDIEDEFAPEFESLNQTLSSVEKKIKEDVVQAGETVKGNFLMAVFSKGRVSWDTKGLNGVLAVYPQLEQFRKQGDPSVSIRSIK